MYVDIVISNVFNLNKLFFSLFFLFLFFLSFPSFVYKIGQFDRVKLVSLELYRFTSSSVFLLFHTELICALLITPSEKRMHHSVWLKEMGNSCTSVFPNTRAWEQQEWNKIEKQTKTVRRVSLERSKAGRKKTSPDGLSLPNQTKIIIINIIC